MCLCLGTLTSYGYFNAEPAKNAEGRNAIFFISAITADSAFKTISYPKCLRRRVSERPGPLISPLSRGRVGHLEGAGRRAGPRADGFLADEDCPRFYLSTFLGCRASIYRFRGRAFACRLQDAVRLRERQRRWSQGSKESLQSSRDHVLRVFHLRPIRYRPELPRQ